MTRGSVMFLGLLALAGCSFADAEQSAPPEGGPKVESSTATRVEVATLGPTDAAIAISLPGEVEGWHDALLASALGGRVDAVTVANGSPVRRGQVLVRVDSEIYAAQRDQAQAQLEQARSDAARLEALGDMATKADRERAGTQVKLAEAQLRLAEAQLDQAVLRAPFDGTVSAVDVEVGEFAAPGRAVLRLSQLDPVKITLAVPDRDVVALAEGMEVLVSASSRSDRFPGAVAHVGAAADLETRAFPVEVRVDNPDGLLLPGMIVKVEGARTVEAGTVVIPQDWVVSTLTDRGVFLEREGRAVWRTVTLGAVVRDQVVVAEGLAHGDRVVITGHRDLADGDEVIVSREATCCRDGRAVFGQDATAAAGDVP